tara:strand:+ start:1383 stop:1547 length:165 start_codon:yes stop_codon:yes gene_type:complete
LSNANPRADFQFMIAILLAIVCGGIWGPAAVFISFVLGWFGAGVWFDHESRSDK